MSDLPEYSYNHDTEGTPLIGSNDRKAAPRAPREPTDVVRHNVTYVFEPIYPMPGKKEQVVGPLGRDMEECIDIVQRAFPTLLEYPRDRVQFEDWSRAVEPANPPPNGQQLPTSYPPSSCTWSRILEDAWPQFANSPPSRLRVTLRDTPGDIAMRKKRERRALYTIFGSLGGFFVFIALLFTTLCYVFPDV